ncbi:uncharacterized protein PV09_04945 [Verruconis gallopava]|uniref:Uncharacterized protein n=1 Tax=Verruconis gallopava TaxID=253628 RepID=A0A0D1YTZ6_9PEZI|nr:uncharacterized protein PV09_04945 [Verruconis gallopava]KIW04137.1 hypothetical protein PV09_04945 [Verruconis gallopava]
MPVIQRIKPQSRPLRPPLTKFCRATRTRSFARSSRVLLVSHTASRPQLSFLNSSRSRAQLNFISRLISTETKRFIKEQSWLAGKYTFIGAVICSAGLAWAWMLTQEMVDRDFPAPKEWTFLTKVVYHAARGLEVPSANATGTVNWWLCGLAFRDLLKRLEDPGVDGKGLRVVDEADVVVPGMGHTGFDIEDMSYEWKRGYYEALMGCGRAAIELEDAVVDTTRDHVFKRAYMVGPSNPRPKKIPRKGIEPPLEENCVPAYAPPETYYLKILTTKGFTNKEKMDAALAYAGWLDFKGLNETAEEMYQWALDLALSGVDEPAKVLDRKRGIIKPGVPVTSNILDATTALAVHRAQTGDTNTALPIFLSILRAQREAQTATPVPRADEQARAAKVKRTDLDVLQSRIASFWSLLQASKFPDPPPSGNEVYVRTPDSAGEEAAIMAYIGEVLFASSPSQREAGLSWTKSAVELAYWGYQDPRTSREGKIKCIKSLSVGTENRKKMVDLQRSRVAELDEERRQASLWRRCIPGLLVSQAAIEQQKERWEQEWHDAGEFSMMLSRGRVFDFEEEPAPVWGATLLREWIIPRFTTPEWRR